MSGADYFKPLRVDYRSQVDGTPDWYLLVNAGTGTDCLVNLHGHGSAGDQFFLNPDDPPQQAKMARLQKHNLSVIAPNLRDNAWMCPAAVSDLADILAECREKYGFRRYIFICGSMGGTGALIFSMRHPELVDALGIMAGVTNMRRYLEFLRQGDLPIHKEILEAIASHYTDADYDLNHVAAQAGKLAMPLFFAHGEDDQLMPVTEMYDLRDRLSGKPDAVFRSIPAGDHNSPGKCFGEMLEYLMAELDRRGEGR